MKKILSLLLAMAMAFSLLTGCSGGQNNSATSAPESSASSSGSASAPDADVVLGDEEYEVIGLQSATKEDGTVLEVTMDLTTDFGENETTVDMIDYPEVAQTLYKYNSQLRIKAAIDENGKLTAYSVISAETGEDLGALTPDEIYQAFDWEVLYEVVDLITSHAVQLSQLEDGKAYKLTFGEDGGTVEFNNDTGKNVMVYGLDSWGNQAVDQFCPAEVIGEPEFCGMDVFGETLLIRKVTLEQEEVENVLGEGSVFHLSGVELGVDGDIGFAKVIENDTDSDLKVFDFTGTEYLIPAGAMVGCNWMDFDVFHAEKP